MRDNPEYLGEATSSTFPVRPSSCSPFIAHCSPFLLSSTSEQTINITHTCVTHNCVYLLLESYINNEINNIDGERFEKEMRASIIHHDKVSYVFLGSQTHMLLNMFTHKNRAFYQFGKIYELRKIPEEIQLNYLRSGFNRSDMTVDPDICTEIIKKTDNIPHYVQYLASATWETGLENNSVVNRPVLETAVNKILINQYDYYFTWYEKLTAYQKKVLHALKKENKNIFNAAFIEKYRLTSASSVQRAVERFIKDGILEKKRNMVRNTKGRIT